MIIFDSSAWIEYLIDSNKADIIENYFDSEEILTPSIVLIELSCKAEKEGWDFKKHLRFIKSKSSIIGMSEETIVNCGKTYIEQRKKKDSFGMIDAVILTISREKNVQILTKDRHFQDLNEAIIL